MGRPGSTAPTVTEAAQQTQVGSGVLHRRFGGDLAFLTWSRSTVTSPRQLAEPFAAIAEVVDEHGLVVLHERVFCSRDAAPEILAARSRTPIARRPIPPTLVDGSSPLGSGLTGLHVVACRPAPGTPVLGVQRGGVTIGAEVSGRWARYLALNDIGSALEGRFPSTASEAEAAIDAAARILQEQGWSARHIRRTWFFLDDILSWYDDFNRVRHGAFARLGLDTADPAAPLPASTGIAGRGIRGRRCTLDLLAIRAVSGQPLTLRRLVNPLQNEAPEYGSDFSRGLEITCSDSRIALVSGTAAIDTEGRSLASGDVGRQIACTLDTVQALLGDAGMGLANVAQATAFLKQGEHFEILERELGRRDLGRLPMVTMVADVCRPELLFELDAIATSESGE